MLKKGECTLYCITCGSSKILNGTVSEELIADIQETIKQKYYTGIVKCCQRCLDFIQAKIAINIPENILESVKTMIQSDGIKNVEHINCELIRKYLKRLKVNDCNNYVPLIHKLICKSNPVYLTDKEEQTCISYFKLIIVFFDKTKETKSNRLYHFYFVYKILEIIIDGTLTITTNKNQQVQKKWKINNSPRKTAILNRIHLQSKNTLISNDLFWKKVCVYIPEFEYRPTIRKV